MSDMPSTIEQKEVGEKRPITEFPPIPTPKKITEGDINIAVEEVIKEAQEQRLSRTANAFVESANGTALSLVPEKARKILELPIKRAGKKAALTVAAVSFLISSGCGNIEKQTPPPPTPTPAVSELPGGMPSSTNEFTDTRTATEALTPEPTQAPTVTPTATPEPTATPKPEESEYKYLYFDTIKVAIDNKEGLPVYYIMSDGTKTTFNKEEIIALRQQAIASGEPEIIAMLPVSEASIPSRATKAADKEKFSKEHPVHLELPKDVLPEEELTERGVKIIQADNTRLSVREGAFDGDGILAGFNNTGRQLTIVLVDGPVLSRNYMRDEKYDGVRNFFHPSSKIEEEIQDQDVVFYRDVKIVQLEGHLQYYREKLRETQQSPNPSKNTIKDIMREISFLKENIFLYKKVLGDKEIFDKIVLERSMYIMGYYDYRYEGNYIITENQQNAIVFLAVGRNILNNQLKILQFDDKGSFNIDEKSFSATKIDSRPKPKEGYPNPADFETNLSASPDNPGSYPYGVQTAGFSLRHEVVHDKLIAQPPSRDEDPNYSEYATDIKAMEGIETAWKKWEESGFKDNSGYYFVFSLSPEEGGGYILTKHESASDSSTSSEV